MLSAHAYLRVERPPVLWEADVDDLALAWVIGEMLAAALLRGAVLEEIVLRANNVKAEASSGMPAAGDYVALTVIGAAGDWRPEVRWWPGGPSRTVLVNPELDAAAKAAGAPFAYSRSDGEGGSVTVFLRRAAEA